MDKGTPLAATTEFGRISVSTRTIAQIVGRVTAESYGIVGIGGRRFPRFLSRNGATDGIDVKACDGCVEIDLHVIVEYGLRLAEVAAMLRDRVVYEVTTQTGVSVARVEVLIDDARRS